MDIFKKADHPAEPKNSNAPANLTEFKQWLEKHGGGLHEEIYFHADNTGLSVRTRKDLPSGAIVASCPFALAITTDATIASLQSYCRLPLDVQKSLKERQRICTYVALHSILEETDDTEQLLRHRPYIAILPKADSLLTPLYFTPEEMALFKGTNMYGAALDQRSLWEGEWRGVVDIIREAGADQVAGKFTWEMYRDAATYLSSRAFPSTLLSANPSLVATPESYPTLIPGMDVFNHARGQAVTWRVVKESLTMPADGLEDCSGLSITVVLDRPSAAGSELFINYGPKPNSSLVLGYGFATPDNPDDTILLKVASSAPSDPAFSNTAGSSASSEFTGHEIGRNARNAEALWMDVRERVASQLDEGPSVDLDEEGDYAESAALAKDVQLDLETADVLAEMVTAHLERLPSLDEEGISNIRPAVKEMWSLYVKGQQDILRDLLAWIEKKESGTEENARVLGINILNADDENDLEEE